MSVRATVSTVLLTVASVLVLALTWDAAPSRSSSNEGDVILFSYFQGNGETGVHLQASSNGLAFEPINDGEPVFQPPESWPEDQQLTRDPSIVYHEGTFHMVWTTNWEGRMFGYARSPDLRTWSDATPVRPFPDTLPETQQPNNIWAPELHHDPVNDDFFVVFSSTIPARLETGDEGQDAHGHNHRMYVTRTENFEAFSDAEVLYDPGFSSIDGQMVYDEYGSPETKDDRWIMIFKHERMPEHGGKNLRLVVRDPVTGAFSDYSAPIVGPGSGLNEHWAEGPTLLKNADGGWNLYWDPYSVGYYGLAQSPDLQHWTDATEKLEINVDHPRHGTFFRAPASAVGWPAAQADEGAEN